MNKLLFSIFLALMSIVSNAQDFKYQPRMRVIIDNDFAGDPDGLVALAHHLLSPSVDVRGVVSSYFPTDGMPGSEVVNGATEGADKIRQLYRVMGDTAMQDILIGGERRLSDVVTPVPSEGAMFIIQEAMRDDVSTPLYVTCGGSLNTIASALLMEPEIAHRIKLVWIGGAETLDSQITLPGAWDVEYNTNLDIHAAQVVFNNSDVELWIVPRPAYRQCNYSHAELETKIKSMGALGQHLYDAVIGWFDLADRNGWGVGETYVLGDSPLVLLTALQSFFEPDPSSCKYVIAPAPTVDDSGRMSPSHDGRSIRIYTDLDTRLMFGDMEAKLQMARD